MLEHKQFKKMVFRRILLALVPLLVRWEQAGPANGRVYRCRESR